MMSLSDNKKADITDAFSTTSRYLDDILNIYNVYFDNMVSQIYPSELQLNKAFTSDTEVAFLDLHLSISNDISAKNYDKCDDFDFEINNFPFLDGDVPRSTSFEVYISLLIRFTRVSSYVAYRAGLVATGLKRAAQAVSGGTPLIGGGSGGPSPFFIIYVSENAFQAILKPFFPHSITSILSKVRHSNHRGKGGGVL